ncbi:MAG: DTW domain-containing protein [Endozoicomonadaceae bacterium]|nr:DTW domain-containing protein [Endozoicomonadaceae bacterium]
MSRVCCSHCLRPEKVCFCRGLKTSQAPVDLLILQHPNESRHALNTAEIVRLSVSNAEIFVDEDFSSNVFLQAKLNNPDYQPWLLFPNDDAQPLDKEIFNGIRSKTPLFIIIDATWRKARKIYYLSTCLHSVPCVKIITDKTSGYRIRKVPAPGYLSTVEAAIEVLKISNHNPSACESMLEAFEQLIDSQITAMGHDLYAKNYSGHLKT